jgi:hypothetical protein
MYTGQVSQLDRSLRYRCHPEVVIFALSGKDRLQPLSNTSSLKAFRSRLALSRGTELKERERPCIFVIPTARFSSSFRIRTPDRGIKSLLRGVIQVIFGSETLGDACHPVWAIWVGMVRSMTENRLD